MKTIFTLSTILATCLFAVGCGSSSATTDAVVATPASIDGSKFLLDEEPDDAVGVIEAREMAKDGQSIVVVGRIGGAANPWVEGRAAFTLIDASKLIVADGEESGDGEICMDDCCAEERGGCTTLVKVVDADGKLVPADARKLLGVADSDMLVVSGKVSKDDAGNFAILASGVHIRR
jgi:hypothetical protein